MFLLEALGCSKIKKTHKINTKIMQLQVNLKIHNQFDICLNVTNAVTEIGARSRSAGLLDNANRKYGNKKRTVP